MVESQLVVFSLCFSFVCSQTLPREAWSRAVEFILSLFADSNESIQCVLVLMSSVFVRHDRATLRDAHHENRVLCLRICVARVTRAM